jgi:hypothetical protein
MPRRRRARETQLDLDWTASLRWSDLPAELREELRTELLALLAQVARRDDGAGGGRDE